MHAKPLGRRLETNSANSRVDILRASIIKRAIGDSLGDLPTISQQTTPPVEALPLRLGESFITVLPDTLRTENDMAKTVLVTGGAGFIGSHLADQLLERGWKVRALDSLTEQVHGPLRCRPAYLADAVELRIGDIRDRKSVV